MAKSQAQLVRYFYTNRIVLRRIVNILMRVSSLALFFFVLGMEQRFTPATQFLLLDIIFYSTVLASTTTFFMILLRIAASRYRRLQGKRLLAEIAYLFVMILLIILSSTRIWFEGTMLA